MAPLGTSGSRKAPALEYFEVRFVEIEALLDLPDGAVVASGEGGVAETLHAWPGAAGRAEYLDGKGREVYGPRVLSGPTLFVDVSGWGQVRRTFARDRSRPIDGKWVYAFRSGAPDGRDAKLVAELSFRNGRFRRADGRDRCADPWKGKAQEAEALLLERAPLGRPGNPYGYFFHLSSFRLPEAAVARLAGKVAARGVSLGDPFQVDVHPIGAPAKAASVLTLAARGEQVPGERARGYRVHLVDALREGIRRAHSLSDALDAWASAQELLAANPEYVLAKRVQLVTEGNTDLRSLVARGLFDYLGTAEKEAARCFLAAHVAMGVLLRWIGAEQRPGRRWDDGRAVQVHEGRVGWRAPSAEAPWGNAFSSALRDAFDGETDEARRPFWEATAVVHQRLNELESGRAWLQRNLGQALDRQEPIADAGAALVFQGARKAEQAIPAGLGWVLAAYGEAWTRRHREQALGSLQDWISAKYGANIAKSNRAERRAFESAERRELRRARRKGIDALELSSTREQNVKFAKGAFEALSVGIEAVNVAYAIQTLRENPRDEWAWVEATGAVLDGYEALGKVAKGVPALEVELTGRLVALKAVAPLAVVAGVIDVAGGVRGAARAGEGGERFGFGMVTGGAALALVGAFAVTGPVALGVVAIGIALQAAGQGLASQFGPLQRLLRNGRFGDGGGVMAKAADFLDQEVDEPWYAGRKLSALKADLPGQQRALDEVLYGFEAEVGNDGSRVHLEIALGVPSQLTDAAEWTIDATVKKDGAPGRIRIDAPVLMDSPEKEKSKFVHLTDVDPPSFRSPESRYAPVREVSVEGTVKLDVRGDGKTVITRPIRKVIRLGA